MNSQVKLGSATLLEIIKIQTEVAKMGLDLGAVMNLVTEQSQILARAAGAVVELAEGDDMVYQSVSGIAAGQLGLRLKRSTSLSGLCVQQERILNCNDSETDARVDREACRRVGLRSMLVVPLKHNDTAVGVLKVMSPQVAAFAEEHVQVLALLSELIASAMFHAVKFETNALYYRATHDALTGLANRALFFDRLRQSLAQTDRQGGQLGILNIDLDGLKLINDSFGHRAGDAAIKEAGNRINETCRKSDTVARLGGDEFGVILSSIDGIENVQHTCERLAQHIAAPFQFDDRSLQLGASIGFAIFPDDAGTMDGLIEVADQAMYARKRARKTAH